MKLKLRTKQLLQSLGLGLVLPCALIWMMSESFGPVEPQEMPSQEQTSPTQEPMQKPISRKENTISVLNASGDKKKMDLEAYIVNVILGEVSTGFHPDALKAQAVAARTYTMYCIETLNKHTDGAVCTDHRCCQAYRDPETYLQEGGTEAGLEKVRSAVEQTAGEVLCYDSQLICATYFASSGGITEDALEVWGESYPYLQPVTSPGEEECGYYSQQTTYTPRELQEKLGIKLQGKPSSWFGMVTYTAGGGVDLMRIGGRLYTGVELRKLLGLRSTVMTITPTEEQVIIETRGYGHRVGMSQHGANAMAETGNDYRQILMHYYTDTTLELL